MTDLEQEVRSSLLRAAFIYRASHFAVDGRTEEWGYG